MASAGGPGRPSIVVISPDGAIVSATARAGVLLGYGGAEELIRIGDVRGLYVNPQRWDDLQRILRTRAQRHHSPLAGHLVLARRGDGSARLLVAEAGLVRSPVTGSVLATEMALAEAEALSDAASGLIRGRLRAEVSRLRVQDEARDSFLRAAVHELGTPLAVISMLADVLASPEFPPANVCSVATRIGAASRKLDRLLENLLDLDRIARGRLEPDRVPTDVISAIRAVVAESDLDGHIVLIEDAEVTAEVDPWQLEGIVANLLANAVRHTPEGTSISIRAMCEPGGLLLTVEDSGAGVPDALKTKIFEPFERGEHEADPGTGIGLAVIAMYARSHGGRAWVEDRPGGGARFRVFLPDPGAT